MATQAQLVSELGAVKAQLEKIFAEVSGLTVKIVDLEAALENQPNVTPELQAAVDDLKVGIQAVDDLVPDAPPVEEPPVEETP